ncbi:MAG TPA: glycosyltransferase, partial [Polyangiaceae bacterium]|nr:glycosyltransferase [Polyangiaceae bacterium]
MRVSFVVPAFQNERSVGDVVRGLREAARELAAVTEPPVLVVDDGSTDTTAEQAREAGALVLAHAHNRGKGRALLSGFARALELGA